MAFHTQQSLSGFIVSDPQRSVTETGETCSYVRVGQPHFRHEYSGSFTALEPTFHDLVAYRATAERALTRFAKGDSFVAEGYVRTYQVEHNGETVERGQFVAKKIRHDLARINYEVDRTRHPAVAAEQVPAAAPSAMPQEAGPAHAGSSVLGR
jgi:single-stranded DNA-binding protein